MNVEILYSMCNITVVHCAMFSFSIDTKLNGELKINIGKNTIHILIIKKCLRCHLLRR